MISRITILTALALMVTGLGALSVGWLSSRQVLDQPGVKLSAVPLIGEDGRLVRTNSVAIPTRVDGFQFQTLPVTDVELISLPPDTVFGRGAYRDPDGNWAQLNVVVMGTDRTSIHRPDYCLTGQGLKVTSRQEIPFAAPGKPGPKTVQRFDFRRLRTTPDGRSVEEGGVYVFWFVSRDRQTASHWQRQWWMIQDLVTRGMLQRWAYISVLALCPPGAEDDAFRRVSELISATAPYFEVSDQVASR